MLTSNTSRLARAFRQCYSINIVAPPFHQGRNTVGPTRSHLLSTYDTTVKKVAQRLVLKSTPKDDAYQPLFEKGDKVQVEIASFGRLGASVDVIAHNSHDPIDCISADEPALGRGLILQREIAYYREKRGGVDIVQYETLPAFVEKVREVEFDDGRGVEVRLDISLRPIGGKAKALELGEHILQKLIDEGGALSVGDKSSPEDINSYFPGASKKAFKKALSDLYKKGLVQPAPEKITLMKK